MIKVCLNCQTENSLDAVFCSQCGMSVTRAPTGEEAVKAREAFEAESPSGRRSRPRPEQPPTVSYRSVRQLAGLLVGLVICGIVWLGGDVVGMFVDWVLSSASRACPAAVCVFLPILAFAAFMAWPAAKGLGAGLAEMRDRIRASREARRLGVDMIRRHLTGIELSKADLDGANAEGADLQGAILPEASLVGATLRRANLSFADLRSSDLEAANLAWAELERAILVEARLVGANLRSANLSRASLQRSDLSNANLFRANLQGAHLESANLLGAHLEGANVEGAHLAGANLDDTTVMPEGWEEIVATRPEDEPLSESADEGGVT